MSIFSHGTVVRGGNLVMADGAGAFYIQGMVVDGANEATVLCLMGEGRPKLPCPIDTMRNSLVESSIMAHCGVDAPLLVEPMKLCLCCRSWGKGQAVEVVGDELKVPMANGFTEGESTTR
jgi:hypothetical protein